MPLNNEAHEKRLQERGVYSESQINWTLNRAEMYAEYNRMHPGFFDMMINSGKYPLSSTIVPQDNNFTTVATKPLHNWVIS